MWLRDAGNPLVRGAVGALARVNARHPWSHNDHFHGWVLRRLPVAGRTAVDIGCGRGGLVRALAPHVERVVGIDSDAEMRRAARACTSDLPNVRIVAGDLADVHEPIDLVTMIAVLHHLDAPAALAQIADRLAPGGRFLVVGLAPPVSLPDKAWDLLSAATNPIIGLAKHPRADRSAPRRPPFPVKDPTLSFDELRAVVAQFMPGAVMRHRLAFRFTLDWRKPGRPRIPD